MSEKPSIDPRERLIFALDVADKNEADKLVRKLGDSVMFYKLGLEFFLSGDYFPMLESLAQAGKKIFADLKFFDVPATVASAIRQIDNFPVHFTTVHGNDGMMRAAAEAANKVNVLAVTALTSLDRGDLDDLGFQCDVQDLVVSRARRALDAGCAGVVASGQEASLLRQHVDPSLMVVCPGIRPVANDDDQKRTVNVEQAFSNGADYIVVGRPIRNADSPRAMAESIQGMISDHFSS